jgi:dihydropteroate synthase
MSAQIMAIINTSPDSFSGDGLDSADTSMLRQRIAQAIKEGADILDIGGQSTRPGAEIIDEATEMGRIKPAIAIARQISATIPISIDTFKPAVARAALDAGATILNDITGFTDDAMVAIARERQCDIVVMHMRGTPQTMSSLTDYSDGVANEVKAFFIAQTKKLVEAGVKPARIIIDPGIGFAKTAPQSFELTKELANLKELGFRILYGASNKSFLGKALAKNGVIAPVEDRAVATEVVNAYALLQGANILRVHTVRAAVQTRAIISAIQATHEVMP